MAHLYISEGLSHTVVGATITLDGAEARHAASVSRLRVGEIVLVSNGTGLLIQAEAQTVAKDQIGLTVVSVAEVAAQTPAITLIQALAKGDRDERAIEMATELGVTGIVPWQSARSVSRWEGDKAIKGRDRWQAIVREASKQAVRAWVPVVHPVATTKEILSFPFDGLTLVLDPSGATSVSQALSSSPQRAAQGVRVVVGPEGGLSTEEVAEFAGAGAVVVGLGANILRTSTAGPAVIAVVNELLARW